MLLMDINVGQHPTIMKEMIGLTDSSGGSGLVRIGHLEEEL